MKEQEIRKKIQARYDYDALNEEWYRYYISKCPYCRYTCEVPKSYPSLLDDVCIHYDHTEGKFAVYKATGAAGSVYIDPFERR